MICEFWRTLSCRLNMVKPSLLSLFSMFCQFNLLLVTPKNTIIVGETTIVIDFPRSEWWLQLCCLGAQGAQGGSGANEIGRRPHSLLSWVTTWLTRIYRQFIGVIAIVRWGNKPAYKLGVPFLKEKDKKLVQLVSRSANKWSWIKNSGNMMGMNGQEMKFRWLFQMDPKLSSKWFGMYTSGRNQCW